MKIHISEQCKMALDTLGGYMSEPAGSVDIVVSTQQLSINLSIILCIRGMEDPLTR